MIDVVSEQDGLDALCADVRKRKQFCFDTEFIRDDTYDANLCLVQVAVGSEVVLFDPLAGLDLTEFWSLVTDPAILTIVHAGKEDFEVCVRKTGKAPRNVFDVQIAAGFVGYGYPMSLSRLVYVTRRKRISKGQTLTDWSRRPLTEDQLRYAAEDVVHLPAIYTKIEKRLDELGRAGWAKEEFDRFENAAFYRPPAVDRLARFKGARRLDGLGLEILLRLIEWRDQWAAERNRPLRAMMRDDMLVEVARRGPRKATDLEVLRGFPQAKNKRVVEQILQIVEQSRAVPPSQRPAQTEQREETPTMRVTLDLLSAVLRFVCFEDQVSQELVGGAQRLRDLLDHLEGHTSTPPVLLTGWRRAFIGERLVELLSGKSELHLSGWPNNLRLDIITDPR
ncbi:MAG: ribonuclease D [Phycisphaerales bacterium]|nr:ribonuclease D [Phycisphaerales bacterium]